MLLRLKHQWTWAVLIVTVLISSPVWAAFTDTGASLPDTVTGSVAWGDYDNDGDLDIIITGFTASGPGPVSKIYRNDGGTFTDSGISLTDVSNSSAAWGDYDNDGDLDILLTGQDSMANHVSKIYRNNGGAFSNSGIALTGVSASSAAWGDYDNDGDLDILLTGFNGSSYVSKIYRNDGGTFIDSGIALTGVHRSSVAWGDYDNDGDLDILLTGRDNSVTAVSIIYRNDGGTFIDSGIALTGVYFSGATWGDYDNDGDLDIILAGEEDSSFPITKVYRNDGGGVGYNFNTAPTAPAGLSSIVSGTTVTLSWDASSDPETPPNGLTYNIRVGTVSGGLDTVSPMADVSTGWRMIPAMGRAGQRQFAILENVDPTHIYFWSVQAVDTAFEGSAWSDQARFGPPKTLTVIDAGSGTGAVTSNPAGIACGGTCSFGFTMGGSVTLTATADAGSTFTGWFGGGCSGTGDCTVTMDAAKAVAAVFDTPGTTTNVVSGSGGGGGGCFVDTAFSGWRIEKRN